ncbi:MAG: ArsS family sensor histidine kinase [Sulfurimonas sp.]
MNKHSIFFLISLFFLFIFITINALFFFAHQYFLKERQSDQIQRFLLADKLLHHPDKDFLSEVKDLMIQITDTKHEELLLHATMVKKISFGTLFHYKGSAFFIATKPPPPPSFVPKYDMLRFEPFMALQHPGMLVLEDTKVHSLGLFWLTVLGVDFLILLFFFYLIKKMLPLYRLKHAIIAFKEGDNHLNVAIHGEDEIAQITKEFNTTLNTISSLRTARSLFLRNILHELKTPIMKGALTTEALESSVEQERLGRIFLRMDYLLNEFAKMENFTSGAWYLNFQEYRFVDILDHACDMLLCDKTVLSVQEECRDLIIKVDFELFSIALKNLIDNALKYSSSKPIMLIQNDKIALLSQGEVLPREKQNFIKPFNREFENSSAGLGLGLYMTDSVLKKHGFVLEYQHAKSMNCFSILFTRRRSSCPSSIEHQ